MQEVLEQSDGIALLKQLVVVPQKAYAKILEENDNKFVLRQYKIEKINGKFDIVNISYTLNIDSDKITFFSVYLTSDETDDAVCLCMSDKVGNTDNILFDNILSLEENVWNRCLVKD